jgi:hypothetical protein
MADASLEDSHAHTAANLRAMAIFPWKGRKDNQLSFPKNAVITVRKQGESWWAGELGGRVGWFPRSYVKLIGNENVMHAAPQPQADPSAAAVIPKVEVKPYVALFSYEGLEKGELSFKATDVIMVTKGEGTWWEGTCNGRTGLFPSKYVKPR